MKRGLLILTLAMLTFICAAGKTRIYDIPRFTYGVEWSYAETFYSGHHNYFISPEGYRVEQREHKSSHMPNGEVSIHAGYNLNPNWNVSFRSGYIGVGDMHPGLPATLRLTRFFGNDYMADRWFAYGEAGSGISIKEKPQELIICRAGAGYRLSLSRYTKLDIIGSLRYIHTHPDIEYYGEHITTFTRNEGYTVSATLGIGLTF